MEITSLDYVDVRERATELGFAVPTRIAILPRNFDTAPTKAELCHESNALTVRALLRNAGIVETRLESEGERFPCVQENDFTWVGPIIFFAGAALSENPTLLSVSLGVISNYLTEIFRGVGSRPRVKLDLVIEQSGTKKCVRFHYDGPPENVQSLAKSVLGSIHNDK